MVDRRMSRGRHLIGSGRTLATGSTKPMRWRRVLRALTTPARLLVVSFLALILIGTLGMMTLPGLFVDRPLGWTDALFTVTSAVCVTGLTVVDTATYFTAAGQAYILLLIQLGGLGILAFTTLLILALGRRLSLRHEAVTTQAAEVAPEVDFRRMARHIVGFTLAIEALGALVLFLAWIPDFEPDEALWHAVFHSISAFCNAGFSTFSQSLVTMQRSPQVLTPIMALIVLGGMGFLTLEELSLRSRHRGPHRYRLSLHSRVVLTTTAAVLLVGWIGYAVLEWSHLLAPLPAPARLLNALFMSVTSRTAGFNTVDYGSAAPGTNFFTMLLMSIGGSPGSTAGGLKTTTVAVIVLLAWARWHGRTGTSTLARTIPEETVERSVSLFVTGFVLVTGGILALVATQPQTAPSGVPYQDGFLMYMFEAVSAFNTVGLSMGITADLTPLGKGLIVFLMYLGRVGPLTFAAAIAIPRREKGEFRYAREDLIIG